MTEWERAYFLVGEAQALCDALHNRLRRAYGRPNYDRTARALDEACARLTRRQHNARWLAWFLTGE